MKIYSTEFIKSISDLKNLQQQQISDLPKIAFFGRSNVGKSSLIASILEKKKLVKVSSSPGKTVFFNFFLINKKFYIIDLPGYGYAKVSAKLKKDWENQFKILITELTELKLILHLLDFRHNPTKLDYYYHDLIQNGISPYAIIATKEDRVAKTKRQTTLKLLEKNLAKIVFPYSSKEKTGKKELWAVIVKALKS